MVCHAQSAIEYKTVAEAKAALLAKPGVESRLQDGWLVISENGGNVTWSFTPEGHEAYPAVAKRMLVQNEDGSFHVLTLLGCEAAKDPCDRLAQSYQALDEAMKRAIKEETKPKP
jgi:hypothetical protein